MSNQKPFGEMLFRDNRGNAIFAKTHGQHELIKAIEKNDITFVNGPAGAGKSYLAAVMAAKYVKEGIYDKIVLVRPVVEAGESMGFLPGTAQEKVAFYMKPLYEFLSKLLKSDNRKEEHNEQQFEKKTKGKRNKELRNSRTPPKPTPQVEGVISISPIIQVEPLGFMRGSTYDNTILICDEFQNTTPSQMKMLLTRIGENSKFIITGDSNQCDIRLKNGIKNGLEDAMLRLHGIDNIGMVELTYNDIVRNKIIKDILRAYDIGRAD